MTYEIHEIAQCYPPLPDSEYIALRDHIKANGLLHPIVLYKERILCGIHRERACRELGIEAQYIRPDIKDPFAYAVGDNERRRNVSEIDSIEVAEKMANLRQGGDRKSENIKTSNEGLISDISVDRAAKLNKVSKTSVERFRRIKKHCIPEVLTAVRTGEITLGTADTNIVPLPKEQQAAALEKARNKPKRAPAAKWASKPRNNGETLLDRQRKMNAQMAALSKPGLTREEVDPDFKGDARAFAAEYGFVNLQTKAEREADRDESRFIQWVGVMKSLDKPVGELLAISAFSPEHLKKWIGRGDPVKRRETMLGRFDALTKAAESIEQYRDILV